MTRVVLAGGGLANCLIAWRLRALRPEVELVIVEQGTTLGGNHTWSFHADDLTAAQREWLHPLIAQSWPGQRVRFPAYERRLDSAYFSLTSPKLNEVLARAPGIELRLGVAVAQLRADGVHLEGGEALAADLVIDGRGAPSLPGFELRWQKFLGLELDLAAPHGLREPLLMDATVAQHDGFRFVYLLPFGRSRLLVEDTYYSDGAELTVAELRRRVREYVAACGWRIERELREETGVLPIVLDGDIDAYWRQTGTEVARSGMRALLFHYTTGYSLPDAVRLADAIAAAPALTSAAIAALVRQRSLQRWREQRFFRLLNRLMFEVAAPGQRYRTLEHFYRMGEPLIGRFYAGQLRGADPLRLLAGRPPVPVGRALGCLLRGLLPRGASADAAAGRGA